MRKYPYAESENRNHSVQNKKRESEKKGEREKSGPSITDHSQCISYLISPVVLQGLLPRCLCFSGFFPPAPLYSVLFACKVALCLTLAWLLLPFAWPRLLTYS